jgi:hypothetical protein
MIHPIFFLTLAAAAIAAIVLAVTRPVRLLARVQIILTAAVVLVVAADFKIVMWLRSMSYADPVRQEWQTRLNAIGGILLYGSVIPWLLFSAYHVIAVLRRRLDKAETP